MVEWDCVIVGAGVGGLTAAAVLARDGRAVIVLEAAPSPGGYQCRVTPGEFAFEPHFHFLQESGPGRYARELTESLGIDLEWRRADPIAEIHLPEGDVMVPSDRAAFIADLGARFPGERAGIAAFFAETRRIHEDLGRLPAIGSALARRAGDSTEDLVSRHVGDPGLRTILGSWAAYFGYGMHLISGPAIAAFTESCFDGGVHQPAGGISSLVDGLAGVVAASGGRVRFGARVDRVVVEGGRVEGVELGTGERISARAVVSSLEASLTLGGLARDHEPARAAARRLGRRPIFRSPFSVLAAVDTDAVDLGSGPPARIVFPSHDHRASDDAQMRGDASRAPVSIGIPTRLNPEAAPEGRGLVVAYTFVGSELIGKLAADPELARAHAGRVLAAAERALPGLTAAAVELTPSTIAVPHVYETASRGALGWSPEPAALTGSPAAASFLRTRLGGTAASVAASRAPEMFSRIAARAGPPGPRSPLPGLYLAGQWTRTGPGMNRVMRSGVDAAHAAIEA